MSDKFWNLVDQTGGDAACWPWRGYRTASGYGQHGRNSAAHRTAYGLAKGPIKPGIEICHTCDNPPCCNPAHLWPGTHLENFADMAAKERSGLRKLTGAQVAAIRTDTRPLKVIAAEYGMHFSAIGYARRGGTWKHVETPPAATRPRAKLTADDVRAIRADGRKSLAIAADYGVSFQQIRRIIRREKWADI